MSRSFLLRGAVPALFALAAGAACADEPAAPVRGGLKVHMDPATGTVVDEAPAASEAQAAGGDAATRVEKPDYNRATMATNSRGTVLMNLNGQVRMYSYATVKPSGRIEETCLTAGDVAAHDGHAHVRTGAKKDR
ncbi:MAG TPA: hypothetical protein VFL14_06980 [Xanthomonadales bacterium]|nr:hypothetical protein [Xanthomonadales bacterium]